MEETLDLSFDRLLIMMKQFYVCALVGVLIKCLYEMHGATIKVYGYNLSPNAKKNATSAFNEHFP